MCMEQQNDFSEREKQVIGLLLQGKSNKQIALSLNISQNTVEYHLKNIYRKLDVGSRTEAVLQLGKSVGNDTSNELGNLVVEMIAESAENGLKPISPRRIPMKNLSYIAIGGLVTTALVVVFILSRLPVQKADVIPIASSSEVPGGIIVPPITSTSILTEEQPADWQEITLTNRLDSADVSLTLKWFYIDSTRVSLEFIVSGFPVPEGFAPTRIIKEISLHKVDGSLIDPDYDNMPGGYGGGGGENNPNNSKSAFDEVLSFPIKNGEQITSQTEAYVFDVTVGGVPVFDEDSNVGDEILQSTIFHFEATPSCIGPLTFFTEKAANIGDKVITLKGAEVNPTSSTITLCVFSPDKQQWLPAVYLLYKGEIFPPSGMVLTNTKTALTEELCYRLDYPVQFDVTDDPLQTIGIWVDKLTKDQPERLPNELISSAFQKLSAQGIEFTYVLGDHGASVEIIKKPAELTDEEVLKMIREALTEEANTSGVLIFDLK